MALDTYSALQSSIADWIARPDLTSVIPDFITLFETRVNRVLQVRQSITSTTLTPSSGSVSLPTDYLEWKRVTWTGSGNRNLEFVLPAYFAAQYPDSPSGSPSVFTIEGSTLKVMPSSDTALSFLYAQKVPALSGSNTTNWLLTANPDVYLSGSLVEANAYMKKGDDAQAWNSKCENALDEMIRLSALSMGPASQRTTQVTP